MFVSIFLIGLCVCFLLLQLQPRRPKNFPPGPPCLPVLGTLLHLNLENPLKDFQRLRESYGNVYSLFMGSKPAVVINGFKAMKEAIVTKSIDFAGRPRGLFINDLMQTKGVIMADYGPIWRERRRFALMNLKNFGLGKKSMEERILEEIQYIIETLEKNCGNTVSPQVMFHNAGSNIICQLLFGTRYEYDDETIKLIVRCFTEITKIINSPWAMLYDSVPLIRHLPLPFNKAFEDMEIFLNIARHLVNEHKRTRVSGEPRDFVDCYLDELENVCKYSFWPFPFRELLLQSGLSGFIDKTPPMSCSSDELIPHIIYPRHSHTEPQHLHLSSSASYLFLSAIGTMIIQNLDSVLREEGQWKFPHEFNPENFLNEQGEFVKPEAFMPFSAGPRVCLGESLARMELFLIVVTLLRRFKFIWPEDAGEPDFTPVYGITLTPKPYRMKVQLRSKQ
ncbi:cytochrome P450 2D26-like [Fundulus heteroclitus]|uniref:cytochrome P450 2D26-like n=1 Tax=Fundulus heteroclitus TaxID=8078 RepID=UPI00165B7BC3|nr:cytochrome P450 2D26-like [Fundulus heteroclitus]